jgi:hypothetical protein
MSEKERQNIKTRPANPGSLNNGEVKHQKLSGTARTGLSSEVIFSRNF